MDSEGLNRADASPAGAPAAVHVHTQSLNRFSIKNSPIAYPGLTMMPTMTLDRAVPGTMPSARALVYLFFFISGIPALVYQLIWQRVLFRIFGLSMDSVTVVVTAFMLGLGCGSLLGSWLSKRKLLPPLVTAAAIELAIGIFGICSISIFGHVDPLVQDLTLGERALVIIGLVFVPTALMGATLPLLIGHLVETSANVGVSAGSLYRINALGGVTGCIACVLLLFPFLGLQASATVAAALNLLVAMIASAAHLAHREEAAVPGIAHRPAEPGRTMPLSLPQSAVLVLASGFISLSFEIFFLHLASFASGSNSVIFAATLAAFILGIASGAHEAAIWCKSGAAALSPAIRRLLLTSALAGLAVLPVVTLSGLLGPGLIAIIAMAGFFVARSLGAIFPLVTHLAVPPDTNAGYRAGLVYLVNILGSAAGSLLTGFVLCDLLGIRAQALLLSAAALALALYLIARFGAGKMRGMDAAIVCASLALALLQAPLTRSVFEAMQYKREAGRHPPFARVLENRYGVVTTSPDGTVFGGGVYDGRFNTDLVHDDNGIVRPYGLSLFHPRPRDVFMIGLASGSWAQVLANNPEVRHLTVVEINPAYLFLVRERPEVSSLLSNPKVTIITDDANRWLKRHPQERYDAIFSNSSYHFRANATNLLSGEFDHMIAGHLKTGGIYMFNTTESARVERTGCESFRYGYRFFNTIIASNDPIRMDGDRWRKNLIATRIDGRPVLDIGRPADRKALDHNLAIPAYADYVSPNINAQPLERCRNVLTRYAAHLPVTDDNMGTEWRYPLGLD